MARPRFLVVLLVLLMPTLVGAQEESSEPPKAFVKPRKKGGALVHRGSGFSFPLQIDGFHRVSPHQYDETGEDVSVGYILNDPGIVVTIYVYPAKGDLDEEFIRRQKELTDAHATAKLLDKGPITVSPEKIRAIAAEYSYTDKFAGEVQPLRSALIVAPCGEKFVEYRITYRAEGRQESYKLSEQLTQDFAWP